MGLRAGETFVVLIMIREIYLRDFIATITPSYISAKHSDFESCLMIIQFLSFDLPPFVHLVAVYDRQINMYVTAPLYSSVTSFKAAPGTLERRGNRKHL